jgi:hypothetical protein
MALPRLAVKAAAGQSLGFQLSKGANPVGNSTPKWLGILLLILVSPLLVMLFAVVGVFVVISALFPAGRRGIRAQIAKWRKPLIVELDREHLALGEAARGVILLNDTSELSALSIHLVCDESASYTRGTDRVTDRRRIVEYQLATFDPAPRDTAGRFEFVVQIPPGVMHSFHARSNTIEWQIEVRRAYPNTGEIKEGFGIMVFPLDVCERLLSVGATLASAPADAHHAAGGGGLRS